MYYAKQMDPEFTEDDLFYEYKDKQDKYHIGINDDIFAENVILKGNKDFRSYYPDNLENLEKNIEYFANDLQGFYGVNECVTVLANYYFKKHNGKRWSKKELSQWKEVVGYSKDYCIDNEESLLLALKLITGKTWRKICIKGCSQSDWQYGYVSEEVTQKDVNYIEMCYFNTGTEYMVYENKEDFENEENGTSYYVESFKAEDNLCEAIGCNRKDIEIWNYTGYHKVSDYCLAQ